MNNIPTPRTEAVMVDPRSDWNGLANLARKLETELSEALRERDEAREERNKLKSLNESYAACWDEIKDALNESEQGDKTCDLDRVLKAIRERDELRELHKKSLREREAAERESDATLERAHRAERERDEAREKYDKLATEHMLAVNNLCEERDEARDQVNRYRYNLDLLPIKWDI